MHVKDLTPNPDNPRTVSDEKLKFLRDAIDKFGDLGAIVFNEKSGHIVSGHQRVKTFDPNAKIVLVKKYPRPTKTGTIAEGYIEHKGENFRYRKVKWDAKTEKAASIAANNNAGLWDEDLLGNWLGELKDDDDFPMSLTMFDDDEVEAFMPDPSVKSPSKKSKGKSSIMHTCPECGHEFN